MFSNVLKERTYYEELKNRIGKKNNKVWKSISGRPFIGSCSYLYGLFKPESYQEFFDKYLAYPDPEHLDKRRLKKSSYYGRTMEDLVYLAEYYKNNAEDESFTLEEFFDDIVCHVIIETFDGHKAEKELMNVLTDYGFEVEETEGVMDAEFGVDLIVKKDGEVKEYIQVKPISTFVRTNPSLISDRSNFFLKQYKLNEFTENHPSLKKRDIIFMLYDYQHLVSTGEVLWYYKDNKVKFKLHELCQTNGQTLVKEEDFIQQKLILK